MSRFAIAVVIVWMLSCSKQVSGQTSSISPAPPNKQNFHLFLLVGQSNMAGRGKVTEADKQAQPNVLMLDQANEWVPAVDPLHFDKPAIVGVGLGRTFAAEIAKRSPDVVVGLIPCAVGGSSITCWVPGGYHTPTDSHPFDDMLVRLRAAMKVGTVKGILWHQGESDSKPGLCDAYEARLHTLIARLRKEIGDDQIPFIAGQLGQFKEKPWNESRKRVDAAHRSLPKQVAHTAFVPSDGLTHKGDQSHFSADSYRELGRRYATAFEEMAKRSRENASLR